MFDEASKQLRWFLLPSEAADCFRGSHSQNATQLPFCPSNLREHLGLSLFSERHIDDEVTSADMLNNNMKVELHKDSVAINEQSTGVGGGIENESDEGINKEELYVENRLAEDTFDAREKVVMDELNEAPFAEGIQKCLNIGFDSSGVSAKSRNKTESNEAGPKSKGSNLEIKTVVCPIENDSKSKTDRNAETTQATGVESCRANVCAESLDTKDLATRCAGSIKCDRKVCENSNLCRKRHAECTEDNQVCEMAKKRTRDEKGIEGVKDADKDVVNDKKQTGRKSKKKKEGTRWFSPPKTIFTPYLKVSKINSFH